MKNIGKKTKPTKKKCTHFWVYVIGITGVAAISVINALLGDKIENKNANY